VANPYFQCKQFIVHQQYTSMKVCTDACLFGAWVANTAIATRASSILDIGTGTGILSLMLAQKCPANTFITSLEIEPQAAAESKSNFEGSLWKERMSVHHQSLQDFTSEYTQEGFDLIISNPPFYEGDLKSPDENKNTASHSTHLPWATLVQNAAALLKKEGHFFVLVPTLRAYTMQKLAETNGLFLQAEILIYHNTKHLPFRSFLQFSKIKPDQIMREKIVIKDAENQYQPAFIELLKDYYLFL